MTQERLDSGSSRLFYITMRSRNVSRGLVDEFWAGSAELALLVKVGSG
jgi:hypothetical protein